ncbi:hypothetical protein ABTX81_37905 [Kitasatospora sp. NPDC097605]|uniref:hypothetical protein n=1 Tax=Kitasatospora sp. NPDC097605 TaxID=3157226 RepID=UPI00332D4C84
MQDSVPRGARVLAVLAVLCAAPAVFWVVDVGGSVIDGGLVVGALVAAAPLLARKAADFQVYCLVAGWALLAFSTLGFFTGLFVLAPAGVVLLAAGRRARPGSHRLAALAGGTVSAVTLGLAGWAIGQIWISPYFQDPDAYLATVREDSPLLSATYSVPTALQGAGDNPVLGHSVSDLSPSGNGGMPAARLVVVFDPRAPAAALADLRQKIADLPGIEDVRLCDPPTGNCR